MSIQRTSLHVEIKHRNKILTAGSHTQFPLVVGRGDNCHIQILLHYISRTHFAIAVQGSSILVKDLGSQLKLRGEHGICEQITFKGQGRFLVGDVEVKLRIEGQPETQIQSQPLAAPIAPIEQTLVAEKPDSPIKPKAPSLARIPASPSQTPQEFVHVPEVHHEDDEFDGPVRPLFEGAMGGFEWALDQEVQDVKRNAKLALQGAVTWGVHIFDIRNFVMGDKVFVSPKLQDEISLPALGKKLTLGSFSSQGANFKIRKDFVWQLVREGRVIDFNTLMTEQRIQQDDKKYHFTLAKNEILTIAFTSELKSHFRYICQPRPFFPRTWFENPENFKKAVKVSIGIHLLVVLATFISAPAVKAPTVENVPPRFARLLVEPPKAPMAAPLPPPPVEPIPVPESPKPIVEKKPIPKPKLPPIPMKTKAVAKTTKPAQPVAKTNVAVKNPTSKAPAKGEPKPEVADVAPEPSAAEKEAAALADLLNAVPTPGAEGAKLPSNIKIAKSGGSAVAGIKIGGIAGAVPSNGAHMASGLGKTPSALAGAGQGGFAATGGSKAGKRKVKGVLAEAPSFKGTEQGLNQDELMAVINKHISAIQRCYERSLFDNPQLVGRVEYEWTITPKGVVQQTHIKRSDMVGADGLNQCVLKVIGAMNFPSAKNGLPTVASVGFPFGKQ